MTEPRRSGKALKKHPSSVRDAREELSEEINSGGTKPLQPHSNRDRARGDWDRTGDHYDEGTSRAEE
jgi:hypothetical protein